MLIYKLLDAQEWTRAVAAGVFTGSAVDLADGYLHFSTADQVVETAARHFGDGSPSRTTEHLGGRRGLLLLTIEADRLGDALRWEPSRGGALFPHLYASMPVSAVVAEAALAADLPVEQAVRRALAGEGA